MKGKFQYMSPQQCRGEEIDARSDIFALGICLYQSITGKSLYHRKTEYEIMKAVLEEPVPWMRDVMPDVPPALDAIVHKALQKEPKDRFQTAEAMQTALEEFLAENRHVVSATKVSAYLQKLFPDEIAKGLPPLDTATPEGGRPRRDPTMDFLVVPEEASARSAPNDSHSAGAGRRKATPWIAGGALLAVLVVMALGALAFGLPRTADGTSSSAPPPTPPTAQPTTVRVELRGVPEGAEVVVDGRAHAASGPIELPRDQQSHTIQIAVPGRGIWRVEHIASAGATYDVVLGEAHVQADVAPPIEAVVTPAPISPPSSGEPRSPAPRHGTDGPRVRTRPPPILHDPGF